MNRHPLFPIHSWAADSIVYLKTCRSILILAAFLGIAFEVGTQRLSASENPNIVWIIGEDMGPDLGCWGTEVHTPHIDQLAQNGMRFTKVFGTSSVCMPNRTAMITGVPQTTLGSVTMRPPKKFMRTLPDGIQPLPELLKEHGYLTANVKDKDLGCGGKNDWNFRHEAKVWDTSKLSDLSAGQPFYAQFNFPQAHRPFRRASDVDGLPFVDPSKVKLPACYPDHPVARRSWADYLHSIQQLDTKVGKVLDWLEDEGLSDNTIVFFLSDHGEAFLRGKYFLYDGSLNQPLIISWPAACRPAEGFRNGSRDDRLLSAIDISAQTLACAGVEVPKWMHGRPFLNNESEARTEIYAAADWIGGSKLKSRAVRTKRYKYIRNFNTTLSVSSASTEYRKAMHPMYHLVGLLAERQELGKLHQKLLLDKLPEEELYDLESDPEELNNLASNSRFAKIKQELSNQLEDWIEHSGDLGFDPLPDEHAQYFDDYKKSQHKAQKKKREQLRREVAKALADESRLEANTQIALTTEVDR